MRCGRAQMLMTAAVDGELASRHRRALDRHLAAKNQTVQPAGAQLRPEDTLCIGRIASERTRMGP